MADWDTGIGRSVMLVGNGCCGSYVYMLRCWDEVIGEFETV